MITTSSRLTTTSFSALFLLPAFITFETTKAILSFAASNSQVKISSTVIAFSAELLKLTFAFTFLYRNLGKHDGASLGSSVFFATGDQPTWRVYGPFAVPAALYLINNLLYLLGLQLTSPSLLHVALLAKLPFTGVLHHILIKRQNNPFAWLSLAAICVGLLVFNMPAKVLDLWSQPDTATTQSTMNSTFDRSLLIGPIIGLTIATFSACASIFTEVVMKKDIDFWVAQVWLYMYGTAFAGTVLLCWDGRIRQEASDPDTSPSILSICSAYGSVIIATAAAGLVVANILRKADNLVKLVGTSSSIVAIVVVQAIIFPSLRSKTIQIHTTLGAGIIAISTWTYSYYKNVPRNSTQAGNSVEGYAMVPNQEERGLAEHRNKNGLPQAAEGRTSLMIPNWRKIIVACAVVGLLTYITSLYTS